MSVEGEGLKGDGGALQSLKVFEEVKMYQLSLATVTLHPNHSPPGVWELAGVLLTSAGLFTCLGEV